MCIAIAKEKRHVLKPSSGAKRITTHRWMLCRKSKCCTLEYKKIVDGFDITLADLFKGLRRNHAIQA